MAHQRTPWQVLGIAPTTDLERVREAYLQEVRKHHPDQYRHDPERYRLQEERMKDINRAYQLVRSGQAEAPETRPRSAPETPKNEPFVVCNTHHVQAIRRCRRCQRPICYLCPGLAQALCVSHYEKWTLNHHRGRALREWGPLILLIVAFRAVDLQSVLLFSGVGIYLAILGFGYLRRKRWLGCLALLLLPYSLILAGIFSLYESLSQWNQKATGKSH